MNDLSLDDARDRDRADPLAAFRDRFDVPGAYMDGNSLGPISTDAEAALDRVVEQWRTHGVRGWTEAEPDWFHTGERLGAKLAPLLGATEDSVVVCNATTTNIHTLVGSFLDRALDPDVDDAHGDRVLVNDLDFPTDHYAIAGQLRLRGLDPDDHLVAVESRDGRTVDEADLERWLAAHDVGVVFMPSVLYRSGQLLDLDRIARAAHEHDAYVGFDLAHSVGVVPHDLDGLGKGNEGGPDEAGGAGVDFAVWCSYKYLNAGPGATAGLYVDERHFGQTPALPGWWGHQKSTQFEMRHDYTPAEHAGAYQIGTVPMLSAAPLDGALDVILDAGIDHIREKSVELTDYLIRLVDERLPECDVGTPREAARRGGHVAVEHDEAYRISEALNDRGVVVDFRPPNVVRVCPAPLYTGFEDVWDVVEAFRGVLDARAYEEYDTRSGGVT